jgi:hypothetical protein
MFSEDLFPNPCPDAFVSEALLPELAGRKESLSACCSTTANNCYTAACNGVKHE